MSISNDEQEEFFEKLRNVEFSRLDAEGHVYLDYTGSGLYPRSVLRAHYDVLQSSVLGNPHSLNPTSLPATELVEQARSEILRFFHANPDKYEVIFTANASSALKLVGECFPFSRGSTFALLEDNHNSVHGIREYARAAGAHVHYIPLNDDLQANSHDVERHLHRRMNGVKNLFAFPVQSNFSGVKHPSYFIHLAHSLGYHVLLDVAAFVPTNRLDLQVVKPDFLCLSFYKMFGFPTGIGALIAKKDALPLLKKRWFAGGTVQFVSVQSMKHALGSTPAAFEDGTMNFLGIPAVMIGLSFLKEIGMDRISAHVKILTKFLIRGLTALRHRNRTPMIQLYGPKSGPRGGTVAFNVLDTRGKRIDCRVVGEAAAKKNISLRTGCFCNPGAAERAFGVDTKDASRCISKKLQEGNLTIESFSKCVEETYLGGVRVSLGVASNKRDVEQFLKFIQAFGLGIKSPGGHNAKGKVAERNEITHTGKRQKEVERDIVGQLSSLTQCG